MSKITVGMCFPRVFVKSNALCTDSFAAGVRQNVAELLDYSNNTKKRNFLETVE
jgi:hypothetical protein